jgi:hypothetical protein
MDNLRVVFFTNQNNYELAELAVDYFKKNSKGLKINIVSNNFHTNSTFYHTDIEYFNMGVNYQYNGKHFGESMMKYLNQISEEYIFFFCDDYFVINKVDEEKLQTLLNYIECEKIDYFGFDDMNPGDTKYEEKVYLSSCDHFNKSHFIVRNDDHRYKYSVQPCIWKKGSLLRVLSNNISLHNLDQTIDTLKEINNIKALGNNLKSHMTYLSSEQIEKIDYFVISYVEIVRNGVFMIPENDGLRKEWEIQTKIVRNLYNDNHFTNRPFFSRLLHNGKIN